MALPAQKVLIIGGGFTGMSSAIALRKLGVAVELVEVDPNWRTDGAGITVSGPTLRAIESLGLLPQFREHGTFNFGVDIHNAVGNRLGHIPTPQVPGSDIKCSGGIMRPAFARAMSEVVKRSGANVRLGQTYTEISDGEDAVQVRFTDGSAAEYDLVVAADGVFSSVRQDYFPDAPTPQYTGQGVWRAIVPRYDIKVPAMYLGAVGKVGYTPVSDTEMYLYYTEAQPAKQRFAEDELLPHLKGLLEEYTAPIMARIRADLNESSGILYRPLEGMLMPRPWYRGRILLTGDCVHATTPHLASGAGMGHEDAVVLGEELSRGGKLQAVLDRFQNRRWERCRMIVANSARLGEIEKEGGSPEEHTQIMALSISALLAPI